MAKFSNRARLRQRLRVLERETRAEVKRALLRGGLLIEGTAAVSIQEQTPSGKFVPSRGRKGAAHEVSPPGSPPNADTGELHTGIASTVEESSARIVVETGSNSPYGPALELGYEPNGLAPRPFMSPAFHEHVPRIREMVRRAPGRAARKARGA